MNVPSWLNGSVCGSRNNGVGKTTALNSSIFGRLKAGAGEKLFSFVFFF